MSRLVPGKIAKIYVSFETMLFILQTEGINFNPLFCICIYIIDAYIEATDFSKHSTEKQEKTDDLSTAICDITQKDWTASPCLTVWRFVMRKIDVH